MAVSDSLSTQSERTVTGSYNQGMRTNPSQWPLRPVFVEYQDKRGVWMHLLSCGHRLVAPENRRPDRRRCVYCAKGTVPVYEDER